ncbi:response regulator transcription factor [Pseudolysinimonas kribbensis]|uniref:DNA-binding response regulator n=1 Tax=Pseudolysinimonas kribbensis TaxID=433641 RepID=A0ABQ6K962_9MICO|nr:response regulator transcription factor [Pseudolysinimonas kribbensis]GMA95372.1 DNA-binding response regulator [Pseudolysinimonas kribbensis]
MARVLVVEDDPTMAQVVSRALVDDGHEPLVCEDGIRALIAVGESTFDAAAIDVMLPGASGFEVCRQIRARDLTFPILMLTARDAVDDRVKGLDSGADDYLTKPFALAEFSARIRALLRRHGTQPRTRLALGNVVLDLAAGRLEVGDALVLLTIRENGLLRVLLTRTPEVVTRPEMLDEVWGTRHIDQNVVDQYVRYVRRKLESAGATAVIETVRGRGYRIVEAVA